MKGCRDKGRDRTEQGEEVGKMKAEVRVRGKEEGQGEGVRVVGSVSGGW